MSGFTIRNNSQMYYLVYTLQRPDLVTIVGLLSMLPLILTILLASFVVGKLGKRNALILGMTIVIIANTGQYFAGTNVNVILALTVLSAVGSGLFLPLIWGMLPDTVDYAHWKFGKRAEGIVSSTFIFLQKCSSGVAGSLLSIVAVVLMLFYDLDEKKFNEIIEDLRKRESAN